MQHHCYGDENDRLVRPMATGTGEIQHTRCANSLQTHPIPSNDYVRSFLTNITLPIWAFDEAARGEVKLRKPVYVVSLKLFDLYKCPSVHSHLQDILEAWYFSIITSS